MNSGAGRPAPERIVAKGTLSEVLSQLLTAEARSAIAAAGKQVVTFADQQRPVLATLLKRLVPLARNMEAVFQAPPAASYERLLIEMGYESVEARIRSRWIPTNGGRWAKDLDVSRRKLASALREIVKAADQSPLVMGAGRRSSSRCLIIGRGPGWRRLLPIPVCRSPLRSFEISFEKPPKASPRPLAGSARLRRRYFVTSRKRVEHPLRFRP